ncbi:hypothetical protein HOY82DRAFT_541913 [Tuber indicum]|nr:hypothetical protein HOY82DRAFT_541913 [Tuber indicum]
MIDYPPKIPVYESQDLEAPAEYYARNSTSPVPPSSPQDDETRVPKALLAKPKALVKVKSQPKKAQTDGSLGKGHSQKLVPLALSARKVKAGMISDYNIVVAALVVSAYIAIDSNYLARGVIRKWISAMLRVLFKSGYVARNVSYYLDAVVLKGAKSAKQPAAMVLNFGSEQKLRAPLGSITILEFELEVVAFHGGKGIVFVLNMESWIDKVLEVRKAFAEQAIVKLVAWGWRQLPQNKTRTHMDQQSTKPLGGTVISVIIGG